MNARVCTAVLGGVFLKAGQRHEPTKEKIPRTSRDIKGLECVKGGKLMPQILTV